MSHSSTKYCWGQMHRGLPYQNFGWAMANLAQPAAPPMPHLLLNPTERFPWDDLRKILHGGQRMASVLKSVEILPEISTG